jgi:hypothetical protein
MDNFEMLKTNKEVFLNFMKEKYPVFNNSNIFLRDIQYGIMNFFEKRSISLSYKETEELSASFIGYLEAEGTIEKLSHNTWRMLKLDAPSEEQTN